MSLALRDYQDRGVNDLRDVFRSGARAPLYVLATGGGKTVMFCHIARGAAALGRSVWILVHRQELLNQTSRALYRLGIEHGVIAPGFTPNRRALVQVCSAQTLARRIKAGKVRNDVDLIVVDEAHHATAGTWREILNGCPSARVLGVTATAQRTDGQGLGYDAGGVFDALVIGPSTADLIADGYLCQPRTYAPPTLIDLSDVDVRGGDYAVGEVAKRVDRPTITGDAVDHYRRLCSGAPAIVFCASVAHAEHVAAQFRSAGFRFESIDGSMDDETRKGKIDALGNGRLHGLTSCEIISEGTDIPVVTAAILLRPTMSLTLYLQQVGRALRPVYPEGADLSTRESRLAAIASSAKPYALILDHVGNTLTHGLADDAREWSLSGKPRKGRGERDLAPSISVAQCPNCYAAHRPAAQCPACGHTYQPVLVAPRQVDGELSEVTDEQADLIRRARERGAIRRARTLDELRAYAVARGYKPQWADHIWAARLRAQQRENARVISNYYRSGAERRDRESGDPRAPKLAFYSEAAE